MIDIQSVAGYVKAKKILDFSYKIKIVLPLKSFQNRKDRICSKKRSEMPVVPAEVVIY